MRLSFRGLVIALVLALPAQAQTIETVVVSARVPDPVGNGAFSTVKLGARALQASPQLDEALEQVPGLSLFRRDSSLSANPTTQGVSLREIAPSGAGRALVTLDGVPQNDPFGGWVIWSSLPGEDIASAEIVRGAGAGPYGAGALTGTIALSEAQGTGLTVADVSGGDRDFARTAAAGGAEWGRVTLFGSASYETSGGYIPVAPDQRGAADAPVTLAARNASLGASFEPGAGIVVVARANVYDEDRDSGLVGAASSASGEAASVTVAGSDGWRVQTWLRDTAFANSSVSIAPLRAFTTPTDDQYATPALGWGANAAWRGEAAWLDWEIGSDIRLAQGESREHYSYVSGAFTQNRAAGGKSFVGGVYAEGASHAGPWLFTLGLRADEWNTTGGHLIQSNLASGAVTLDQHFASRSGVVPTARAGLRRDFGEVLYLRAATYKGFRPASLNELYRPFRQGNNVTEANAALAPEELYGGEVGAGGRMGAFNWDTGLFWNRLHRAIANVTIGEGPGVFRIAGFVPAGGLLIQRQNVGDIDAYGLESEAHWKADERLTLDAAFDLVDARVWGGAEAPQLTGKRPAQAPRWTLTGGFTATPAQRVTLSAHLHYETTRYADDQNTLALAPAFTVDARLAYALTPSLSIFAAGDNLFNAQLASTESADHVVTLAAPRMLRAGFVFAP